MSKSHDQKQQMLQLFDKVARTYHTVPFFQAFGQSMVAWSGINQGQTILDIATGRGAVLMPALAAIGPEGRAIAIDSSPRMIEELTHDLRHADANNVHLRVMDAEVLDFSAAHFDAVLCGFAMHLFPYPQNALAEIDRVLKPGGMFVFSVPGPRTSDRWDFYADTITRFQPLVDSAQWSLSAPPDLWALLSDAGFVEVDQMLEEVQIPLPNAATFWDMEMSHGIRGFIEALPDQIQAEFKARVFQGLTQLEEHDGSVLDRAAYFFKALKPT